MVDVNIAVGGTSAPVLRYVHTADELEHGATYRLLTAPGHYCNRSAAGIRKRHGDARPIFLWAVLVRLPKSDKHTGKYIPVSGIVLKSTMKRVLKRKHFARWQASERLPDAALCLAVQELESGLIDASLGGLLHKMRVARPGAGKRGGYRTLLSARIGSRYVFMHGFSKNDQENITQDEQRALQFAGKAFLELTAQALSTALWAGVLLEVHCEQDSRITA